MKSRAIHFFLLCAVSLKPKIMFKFSCVFFPMIVFCLKIFPFFYFVGIFQCYRLVLFNSYMTFYLMLYYVAVSVHFVSVLPDLSGIQYAWGFCFLGFFGTPAIIQERYFPLLPCKRKKRAKWEPKELNGFSVCKPYMKATAHKATTGRKIIKKVEEEEEGIGKRKKPKEPKQSHYASGHNNEWKL